MRALLIVFLLNILTSAIFIIWPQVDLKISAFFYDEGFKYNNVFWAKLIYNAVKVYAWSFGGVILICICATILLRVMSLNSLANKETILLTSFLQLKRKLKPRTLIYLTSVMTLGPGILVHWVLKPNIGRPRPRHIENFGGDQPFIPVFEVSDLGGKSFMSGHSATAFTLCAVALVVPKKYRNFTYMLGIIFGAITGFGRVAQGGHFASDVIFAGLFTLMLIHILYVLFFVKNIDQ